jgi:two-component system OmpR family response regulator
MLDHGRSALVIDADPEVRLVLRTALEANGFVTHGAMTANEGVQLVREKKPDLVTLELLLPDFSGLEACRLIRQISNGYMIMISASCDETDRLIGLTTGADDFVTKPFHPREVQARVEAMFRRPRIGHPIPGIGYPGPSPQRPAPGGPEARRSFEDGWTTSARPASMGQSVEHTVLHHGPLAVDIEGRYASYRNAQLSLTKMEFDLLVAMLRNPRRIWSRENLLALVWGTGCTNDHIVEVHMGNLRRKLRVASTGGAKLIETVRGIGYRLAPADRPAQHDRQLAERHRQLS